MKTKSDLATRIRDELAWDSRIDADEIVVEVTNEVVHVAGTVGSYAEKLAAAEVAIALSEVHDLINDVEVRTGTDGPPDGELSDIIERVLRWDALVPDEDIEVRVNDGWVTLSGSVSVDAQRREAERAVRHLLGLRGISNEIRVAEAGLEPSQVRDAIVTALERRAEHTAAHIDVAIDGHTVTLKGGLASPMEKRAVIGSVSHAPGVEMVCDDITVPSVHTG